MRRMLLFKRKQAGRESGMSMIELMISMTVMAIGISGILGLVLLAMATNYRNRGDTTGTMVAQMIIEQIEMVPANGVPTGPPAGTVPIIDCAGVQWDVRTSAGGANLVNGAIDWTQPAGAVPLNYRAVYNACGPNNEFVTYDVRWSIVNQYAGPGGAYTKVVTVSARPLAANLGGSNALKYFAQPVTLRTIVGM